MNSENFEREILTNEGILGNSFASQINILRENTTPRNNMKSNKENNEEIKGTKEKTSSHYAANKIRNPDCLTHKGKRTQWFCKNCMIEICSKCISENLHTGHLFLTFGSDNIEVVNMFLKKFESFDVLIQNTKEIKKRNLPKLIELIPKVNHYKDIVNVFFKNLFISLDGEKNILLKMIEQYQINVYRLAKSLISKIRSMNYSINKEFSPLYEIPSKKEFYLCNWKIVKEESEKAKLNIEYLHTLNESLEKYLTQKNEQPKIDHNLLRNKQCMFEHLFKYSLKEFYKFFSIFQYNSPDYQMLDLTLMNLPNSQINIVNIKKRKLNFQFKNKDSSLSIKKLPKLDESDSCNIKPIWTLKNSVTTDLTFKIQGKTNFLDGTRIDKDSKENPIQKNEDINQKNIILPFNQSLKNYVNSERKYDSQDPMPFFLNLNQCQPQNLGNDQPFYPQFIENTRTTITKNHEKQASNSNFFENSKNVDSNLNENMPKNNQFGNFSSFTKEIKDKINYPMPGNTIEFNSPNKHDEEKKLAITHKQMKNDNLNEKERVDTPILQKRKLKP